MATKTKAGPPARTLARPGDPYVMPDGRQIQPEGDRIDVVSNQSKLDVKSFKASRRRVLKELPAQPSVLNAIGCAVMYSILGIADREIAQALNCKASELQNIKSHPAYGECFGALVSEFINANSDLIHSRIAAYGHDSLTRVAHLAINGTKEEVSLRASQDLLDRGGFTKKDVNRGANGMDELRITITRGGEDVKINLGMDH